MQSYARKKVASYRHVQQATTTPAQRVVLCYDAVVRDLEKALAAFEDPSPNRYAEVHNALHHAHQILNELLLALDRRAAPGICDSLQNLYSFWIAQLSEANARKTPETIVPVLQMVRELRDTWQQAARSAAQRG